MKHIQLALAILIAMIAMLSKTQTKKSNIIFILLILMSCQKEFTPVSLSSIPDNSYQESIDKPNVLLILIDDMGYEVPQFTGGQTYETPNLDEFAHSNLLFTECHSTPLGLPSRVELMTGKYSFRNYTWGDLETTNKTIGNLMKKAGYSTGIFGKWELGGGDASLKAFGFDHYVVHDALGAAERGPFYRNPRLYTHGGFLPDSATHNKYGDDIVQDSLFKFIDRHVKKGKPFFAYYPMILCHKPFQPTPDDPDFLTFDISTSDAKYYPSMVKYMDKLIGQLITKIHQLGIINNTIIIFTADNGTPQAITSLYNGDTIIGGKGLTTEYGTHVPLIVSWKNHTPVGIDSSLIDFSDILPTLSDIGKADTSGYGTLDGTSFYHNIIGNKRNKQGLDILSL